MADWSGVSERSPGQTLTELHCGDGDSSGQARYLKLAARNYLDSVDSVRRFKLRGSPEDVIASADATKDKLSTLVRRELKKHPIYPWIREHPNAPQGAYMGVLLSEIGDPWRFPGQPCSRGHISPPLHEEGATCPKQVYVEEELTPCSGTMLAPRDATGCRSLWKYLNLAPDDAGALPRRKKGTRANWNSRGKTALMMPDAGIAAQLIRKQVAPWTTLYYEAKARIQQERPELEPYKIDSRARYIMVKAFVGDLLMAWKQAAPLG